MKAKQTKNRILLKPADKVEAYTEMLPFLLTPVHPSFCQQSSLLKTHALSLLKTFWWFPVSQRTKSKLLIRT